MNPNRDMTSRPGSIRLLAAPGHAASPPVRLAHSGIGLPEREGVGER
jgi:hypothetical protein